MTLKEFCELKGNDPMENIFPKGTTLEEAYAILSDHFLPEGWYCTLPANCKEQIITEVVGEILSLYPDPKALRKVPKWVIKLFNR